MYVITCTSGPFIRTRNSFILETLSSLLNLEIPPVGYIYILSTLNLKIVAVKKWPSSWKKIKIYTKINGSKYPMRMENKAKTYTVGWI